MRDDSATYRGHHVTRKATITVLPSAEHPDYLTIEDAMNQIADAFALLSGDKRDAFEWRLVQASTNSPFTAVGEIIIPGVVSEAVLASAALIAQEAQQGLSDLLSGEEPHVEMDLAIARRMLARNLNGIGLTKITLEGFPELVVDARNASVALDVVKAPRQLTTPRRVRGTIEGTLVDAGQYRRAPALKVRERARGRIIWCRIPSDLEDKFATETSLRDVWSNARVRLRGWIEYSRSGNIASMTAEKIEHVKSRRVADSELIDRTFTGGLDAITYLDKLRDGEIG